MKLINAVRKVGPIGTTLLFFMAAGTGYGENLIRNGDFSLRTEGDLPAEWAVFGQQEVRVDDGDAPGGVGQSLRVDVVRDGGSSYGEIHQNITLKPGTLYRLEGKTRSSKPQLALFSIKWRKNRDEIRRIYLPKSQVQWTTTSYEFSSADADEIQVLCRWRQNAAHGWVGQTAWFGDVKLVEIGPAPPPPPWTVAVKRATEVKAAGPPATPVKPTDSDLYVTPNGAGQRDGTSWQNALPGNAPGTLQAAWDALAPGRACRVGSGVYVNLALTISSGGSGPDKMKKLVGEDTGGGLPWLVGDWNPQRPAGGLTLLSLANEVDHCAFEDLQVVRYQSGIGSRNGRHVGLRVRNFDVYEGRWGIFLNGFAHADDPDVASHDMVIEDCEFIHFTKSGIRLQAGNYDVRIINCTADAGGWEWMKESFQSCFVLNGDGPRRLWHKNEKPWASEHDVLFINCVARNATYTLGHYWQGDGYAAEGNVRNVAYINCQSYDCTDGGWDVKAHNVIYVNCIGLRSKRNFRMWNHGFLYNCLSAYSFKRKGSAGLWTLGDVHADRCTFHNNDKSQICAAKLNDSEAKVTLENCLVSFDGVDRQAGRLYVGETRVTKLDTAEWRPKTDDEQAIGPDPQYVAAAESKAWNGDPPDAFDSRVYGVSIGFHSSVSAVWRRKSTDELVDAAMTLLNHNGWDDFQRGVEALTAVGRTSRSVQYQPKRE